jgi:hypothetical protein
MDTHSLLVILFHGSGWKRVECISSGAQGILLFLKQHENEIMIAPMIVVSDYIRSSQGK